MSETEKTETHCPVCGEAIGPAPEICPDCKTPHHWDCWEYNGGCAIYSCPRKVKKRGSVKVTTSKQGSIATLVDKVALKPVKLRRYINTIPKQEHWAEICIVWFSAIIILIHSEFLFLAPFILAMPFLLFSYYLIPRLFFPPSYSIDFSLKTISCNNEHWRNFKEVTQMSVQWTATNSGPALELIVRLYDGFIHPISPPFNPGSEEAKTIEELVKAVENEGSIPVSGKGNFAWD